MNRRSGSFSVERMCAACGGTFFARPFAVKAGKARFCSVACAGRRRWTADDDAQLRVLYPDCPNDVIARFMGRSVFAIYGRADVLGLGKSAMYLASPAACRLRRGGNVGLAFRFQKGLIPANKGLRRPGYSVGRGRMQETQFKKGQKNGVAAAHWMPIGATRLMKDKSGRAYVLRKVADVPNVPYTVNWKLEHRLIWQAAHGPIPPGHKLVFINGNPLDVRLDNLELLTDAQVMARNTVHNLPPELKASVHLLGQLKRRIRERESHVREEHDRRST